LEQELRLSVAHWFQVCSQWVKLENEYQELAIEIDSARTAGQRGSLTRTGPLRDRAKI
jgi:hypothetical protein